MRRIIVDSGSSIIRDEIERYGIDIVPIRLQMGEDSFFDGVDITTEEFYERLKDKILHVTGDLMHLDLSM